jgi:UDP-N-acetylglucosamine 2-epimerase
VLVLRKVTECPEAVKAGTFQIIGMARQCIVAKAMRSLDDSGEYTRGAPAADSNGDGHAAERIVETLLE